MEKIIGKVGVKLLKYLFNRLWQTAIVLLGVTIITFILMNVVPGNPVLMMLGQRADEETVARVEHELGMDQPYVVQYGRFLKGLVHLDLGRSYFRKVPVLELVSSRFATTAKVAIITFAFSMIFGIGIGIIAAISRGRALDRGIMAVAIFGISAPSFWVALLLQIIFGLKLGWLPISGLDSWKGYILPCFALGTRFAATMARFTRTSMLDVIGQDYVRTARAKGLREKAVVLQHSFKNALIPVITLSGMQLGGLLCGAILTETVFTIPGIGKLTVDSMMERDLPLLQGCIMYIAIVVVFCNLLVDLSYALIDPRIRVTAKGA